MTGIDPFVIFVLSPKPKLVLPSNYIKKFTRTLIYHDDNFQNSAIPASSFSNPFQNLYHCLNIAHYNIVISNLKSGGNGAIW